LNGRRERLYKRQILLAKWEKYEREYEDWDSPVICRLGKFMNRHEFSGNVILFTIAHYFCHESLGCIMRDREKMIKFKWVQFLSEKT